jgi:adenylate cyclase
VQKAEALLKQREIGGLQFALVFRLVFLLLFVAMECLTTHHRLERVASVALVCVLGLPLLIAYRRLVIFKETTFLALGGATSDLVLLSCLPFIWWWSNGGPSAVPAPFLVKTYSLMPLSFGVLIMNCLSGRWNYILFVICGLTALQLLLLGIALHDPRSIRMDDFYAQRFPEGVDPTVTAVNIIMLVAFGMGLAFFTKSFSETIQQAIKLERLSQQVSRYFSPAVYATITSNVGSQQNVAILFSDLRGFTALSEKLNPGEVVKLLSAYHTRMVELLFQHQGTVDKFIGDGIMATFGTPIPANDDCLRAVSCAIAMQRSLQEWNQERAGRGESPLVQSIGIHYGLVVAGNIGTPERLEYTVIGDTVNVASRIESLCKEMVESILISDSVKQRLPREIKTRALGTFNLRGKETKLDLHAVSSDNCVVDSNG